MTTKQQERDALAEIVKIVEALGEDSYIGTAFKGCFENAETNIEWDAAFSIADELANTKEQLAGAKDNTKYMAEQAAACTETIKRLEAELEREHEWKPHDSDLNVKQSDYERLATAGGTRMLLDEEATQLIVDEFGFNPERITILHSVDKEEISRHRHCRKVGEYDRQPCYNATDWNYIRFDCNNWYYEMYNGQLHQFYC